MPSYLRPTALDEALRALADRRRTIIAGGTDFYPARVGVLPQDDVLDVTGMSELRTIQDCGNHYRIGALTTWTDVIRADLPGWFRGLKLAAREVGGIQVQNAGTVVGNVCNASPAADGVPCLMALDSLVTLASVNGERELPLREFIRGNRRTDRRSDEMVIGLKVPKPGEGARSGFVKLGARKYLVISIVMVAAVLETGRDGVVHRFRIAVGSCSEVARRLTELEHDLVGKPCGPELADLVTAAHLVSLSPIMDVRGSAEYRRDAALTLVRRLVAGLSSGEMT